MSLQQELHIFLQDLLTYTYNTTGHWTQWC